MKKNYRSDYSIGYSEEMKIAFRDYAMSVIYRMSMPDVREWSKSLSNKRNSTIP